MNYNYKEIGKRIKSERKLLGKSQEELSGDLKVKRSTVGSWENGKTLPSLQTMINMCKMFNCEMGYLLCEEGYEEKTRKITDICRETGFSEDAVNVLKENRMNAHSDFVNRYIINGAEISQAIERLREAPTSVTDRMKYYEFDVMDSFLDLVKEYIRRG